MKKFETDFLEWAYSIMDNKMPCQQFTLMYNDLQGALKDGRETFINSKLSAFAKKMSFIYSKDKKMISEINENVETLKNKLQEKITEKNHSLQEINDTFKFEL